ncbi:carboxyl transferase domain-containing protein [Thalassotalea psychrophila]|uniref:Carboxyl transferase domain-containing protein n=1 Tax=Thalassotalea psychrophila TaxID=3065647 RepID=A0ABY9TZ92_9GAMM|nr:carboxyl transferase domain-containing protein [Colwelliaceae bacterium SQ149]
MPKLASGIDTNSLDFSENSSAMITAIDSFRAIENKVITTAEKARARYEKRGMLMPRERLSLLLDQGSAFLELSSLAGFMMYDDTDGTGAGAGVISGIGYVSGVRCLIIVDNFAIKGGTITPIGLQKKLRLQQIALENKLPIVSLAQSGGANLTYAAETFVQGGRGFANQARLSAAGIPQITVVHGSATAGGAYQPGLSDYIIMVREQATMYLAGPPLLKAATGEIADDETLGGANMHTSESGVGDYLAENDSDGIRIARDILAQMPWNEQLPHQQKLSYEKPIFSAEELIGIVPADAKTPYDCKEIISRIVDASNFLEFKHEYDQQTICGHAKIAGKSCGIIGNNGPITSAGAAKAGQFIQLCEQSNTPLLFLHNITGFMVGTEPEHSGIIKHGSKLIQAVANATVPKFSINVGGSYGAGNYAMCGRGFDPRFLFSWPNSTTAVMGAAQAGMVLRIVAEAKMRKQGNIDQDKLASVEKATSEMMQSKTTALACTARIEDDGLIDPRDTRTIIALLLDICNEAEQRKVRSNTFGIARF